MYYNESFDELPEDMLLHGKLTNDGEHNLFQMDKPPSRKKKKRKKYVDEEIEVDESIFESAKKTVAPKEVRKDEIEEVEHPPNVELDAKNPPKFIENNVFDEEVATAKKQQETPKTTMRMPLRKLFDGLYDTWKELKWSDRRGLLISTLQPYLGEAKKTVEFVDANLDRRRHNNGSRFRRAWKKCNLNRFNYFVTFTYDDAKMDETTFYKKLKAYLKNKATRSGWKYYGVWEGLDGKKRLHFHALLYIPEGTMPGELIKEKRYNTSKRKMKETIGNTEFSEKFGRSDVQAIIPQEKDYAYRYVLKYLNKGGKAMVSKNCPEYIKGWVEKSALLCESTDIERQYIAVPKCPIILDDTGELITLDEDKPHESLQSEIRND